MAIRFAVVDHIEHRIFDDESSAMGQIERWLEEDVEHFMDENKIYCGDEAWRMACDQIEKAGCSCITDEIYLYAIDTLACKEFLGDKDSSSFGKCGGVVEMLCIQRHKLIQELIELKDAGTLDEWEKDGSFDKHIKTLIDSVMTSSH